MKKHTRGKRKNLPSKTPNLDETLTENLPSKLISYIRKRKRNYTNQDSVPVDKDGTSTKEMKKYKRREKGKNIITDIKQYKKREKGNKIIYAKLCINSCILNEEISEPKDGENVRNYENAPVNNIHKENTVTVINNDYNIISSDLKLNEENDNKLEVVSVLNKDLNNNFRERKLLILDINGLLADIRQENHIAKKADFRVNGNKAFKRPFCDDFLRFCFENFKVGIWSSRKIQNVNKAVNVLLGDLKENLLFCWDLSKCTKTEFKTLENKFKFIVLKDLNKIWDKSESDLNFEKGEFKPSNTLLLDDSPYKALLNPPNTAIFPNPYNYEDSNDNSLGDGGDLRCYLEKLLMVNDVQSYVKDHPFGQPAISQKHPSWDFYSQIIQQLEKIKFGESNCLVT